jgi:general secretion pathway protein I
VRHLRATQRGFTLIEVMIAVAILAMALATVFGSNVGAARSTMHARNITRATMMARCRMVEAEAYLLKNQLPPADQDLEDPPATGDDPCCTDGFTCDAKVERVELPNPASVETSAGDQLLGRAARGAAGTSFAGGGGGGGGDGGTGRSDPMGSLAGAMSMMGGGGSPGGGTSGAGGASLAGAGAPGPREMAGMLLSTVYPTVKPLLEGAIRRLTVTVRWNEGNQERSFNVVQYVTNPGQTLPAAELLNAAEQAAAAAAGIPGAAGVPGAGGTPSSVLPAGTSTLGIPGARR